MAERTVKCVKLGTEAPGLNAPPFPGPLGEEIYQKVSAAAWSQWKEDLMIKIINEYRLNMANPDDYEMLLKQMRAFLNLDGQPQGVLEVENARRGGKE